MENKYGTRLKPKNGGNSEILAITSPEMLDNYYIISENKDREKREKFRWTPMSEGWKNNCQKMFWFGDNLKKNDKLYPLREKLLSFGGEAVCLPPYEEDLMDILENGQFWFGSGAKRMKGRACQCHNNSRKLYDRNKKDFDIRICTGYALSDDGMWRQHSWLVLHKERSNQIIETTEPRIGYYGFVMTEDQCEEFCA